MGMRFTLHAQVSKTSSEMHSILGGNVKLRDNYLLEFMTPVAEDGYTEVNNLQGFRTYVTECENVYMILCDRQDDDFQVNYAQLRYYQELLELAKVAVVLHTHGVNYCILVC